MIGSQLVVAPARVPTVSVVVPCYRYGHFLAECVGSVLDRQDGVHVKVLIIDDASPDDSAEQARDLAAADDRIEVRVHTTNEGHLATYNEGLSWAEGDYTVLLSADDMLTPGALTRATTVMEAHEEVGFVYGRPVHVPDGQARPEQRRWQGKYSLWSGDEWLRKRFRTGNGCITSPEVVVRTSLQHRLGGYDVGLPHTGDLEMWLRFAAHAPVAYLLGADQAYYRVHAQSMSRTTFPDHLADLTQRYRAYETVLRDQADVLSDGDALANSVRRALAREAIWRASRAYDRRRTGQVPIDELVAFACNTFPAAKRLPEYAGLQLRQKIGPTVVPYLQPLVLTAPARRIRERLWWERWKRRGT